MHGALYSSMAYKVDTVARWRVGGAVMDAVCYRYCVAPARAPHTAQTAVADIVLVLLCVIYG